MNFKKRYLQEDDSVAGKSQQITNEINKSPEPTQPIPNGLKDNDAQPNVGDEGTDTIGEAKLNAASNTLGDKVVQSLDSPTANDIKTTLHQSLRTLGESTLVQEETQDQLKKQSKFRDRIGLGQPSKFQAIQPIPDEVKELTKQAGFLKNPLTGTKAALTLSGNQAQKEADLGLGKKKTQEENKRQNRKFGQEKKKEKKGLTPGNLDLPGKVEESIDLLLELTNVSRSSAGDTKTLGTIKTGVEGKKPTNYNNETLRRVEDKQSNLNAARDDAAKFGNEPDSPNYGHKFTLRNIMAKYKTPREEGYKLNAETRAAKEQRIQQEQQSQQGGN